MLLEVRDLEVAYGDYQVIWGVSLSVAAGESVALLGPNGSGKSTVVNTISGLLAAKAGEIRLDGASLKTRPTHVRASLGIAHVLERRRVFPHLTVLQNLTLGAWHSAAKAARARTLERVFTLFPRLSECKSQLARTLSGGEQQMLALGRGPARRRVRRRRGRGGPRRGEEQASPGWTTGGARRGRRSVCGRRRKTRSPVPEWKEEKNPSRHRRDRGFPNRKNNRQRRKTEL